MDYYMKKIYPIIFFKDVNYESIVPNKKFIKRSYFRPFLPSLRSFQEISILNQKYPLQNYKTFGNSKFRITQSMI